MTAIRNYRLCIVLIFGFATTPFLTAQVECDDNQTSYFVSNGGSNEDGDGSMESPFLTVQHAIDQGCSGDSIILFPGTYFENISVPTHNLTIGGLGILTGSFNPELTVIDGQDVAVAFYASGDTLSLMDFTIQNGRAPNGAGLTLAGSNHSHVSHLIVRENIGTGDITAHGINLGSNNVVIEHCLITGNYGRKHTVSVGGSNNVIRHCQIVDNNTWGYGGGIVSVSQNLLIENCLIANNSNGGLAVEYTTATVVNTTIQNNSQFGINLRTGNGAAEVRLMNTVLDNTLNLNVWQSGIGTAHFVGRNSIVPGGSNYAWASVYSTFDFDDSVIDGPAYLEFDGSLQNVSGGIGSGATQIQWQDDAITIAPLVDLYMNPRPAPEGSLPDMGCYEHPLGTPFAVAGCTDESACNFDPHAVEDDGSCNLPACLVEGACNYAENATCDGGIEACIMPSCIDESACNYDSNALCDGGQCYYGDAICDDPYACNYSNMSACVDNSTCDYTCCPGPGCCGSGTFWDGNECVIAENCRYDFDQSGTVNLPDLLDFLAHYELTCMAD